MAQVVSAKTKFTSSDYMTDEYFIRDFVKDYENKYYSVLWGGREEDVYIAKKENNGEYIIFKRISKPTTNKENNFRYHLDVAIKECDDLKKIEENKNIENKPLNSLRFLDID
jgi:hypothetical protein